MKIITDFRVLFGLAVELNAAKKVGDINLINLAQEKHDAYKVLCLKADEMSLGLTRGHLA